MITAIVKATIKPDMHQQIKRVADILQLEYAPHERGCELYESFIDGDTFITIEHWHSQQDLDIHLEAEHVKKYVPQLRECVVDEQFQVTFINSDDIQKVVI
ncbi:antibiotic biosynthesis monooxygenase [Bacterioplanes sanyensis]|uniref:Antibiotic biosynthesis monooxygenase n=1 Tax=Bacterioplanes sanyensis TaxID=1249553 RepID=A0A222FH65_9GAMM|nr:antibiotic biosynthesis monooxygenase [Bacterioplanes sanyensis]ASP38328.1 antibiotic biosynthesis monooxygenase [Bacterioplanes sanyensis]